MAQHRVVCTEQTDCSTSGHIVAVGVDGEPDEAARRLTVSEVWAAMDRGQVFYTSDGVNVALVEKYYCGCLQGSLRSVADASTANNLDSLRLCRTFSAA